MIKGPKNAKSYEKSEDPIYALDNNLPIDYQHYLDHYLDKPLLRIFDPSWGRRRRRASCSRVTTRGPSRSRRRRPRLAASCSSPRCASPAWAAARSITDEKQSTALCTHCLGKEPEHLQKALNSVNGLERDFNRLWTQCQRCQGSLHQDVLCTSRDCPIFYRRKKVQKDLMDAENTLKRFDW